MAVVFTHTDLFCALAWWKGEKAPPEGTALKREKERDLLAKWKAKKG